MSSYQAISGAGAQAMAELERQVHDWVAGRPLEVKHQPKQIAFNVIPRIDAVQDNFYTKEEMKFPWEGRKILHHPSLRATATCVRVPVFRSHAVSLNLEFEKPVTRQRRARRAPQGRRPPGARRSRRPRSTRRRSRPASRTTSSSAACARTSRSKDGRGLALWVVGDQLAKGAALNAVQIGELLIRGQAERAASRASGSGPPRLRRAVVILLDSLCRHLLGAYGGREFATPNLDRFAARRAALRSPLRRLAAVHAGAPRPARRLARFPVAAVGLDRGLGGAAHRVAARAPASPRCSSPITRTSSRPAARTTTASSARGSTSAVTRAIRGARGPIRAGRARRASAAAGCPTTTRAATSATRPISPGRARWRPPRAGSSATRRTTSASCSSSTSSTRTSPSTRPSRTRRCTTTTGKART